MAKTLALLPFFMCAVSVLVGCAIPVKRNDWSAYDGPGAEYFQREEYELPYDPDPLEPLNRIAAGINFGVMVAIIDPLATGWRFLVPQPARTSLVNASHNIEYPRRVVNHLLQEDEAKAKTESDRFAANTTVGVLGLRDVAAERGVRPASTDSGMTLNRWGWRSSTYLTLPFGTPGTVRDMLGGVGDALLDPTTYLFPLGPAKGFVQLSESVAEYKRFALTSPDFYDRGRRLWTARRWIVEARPAGSAGSTGPNEGELVSDGDTDGASSADAPTDRAIDDARSDANRPVDAAPGAEPAAPETQPAPEDVDAVALDPAVQTMQYARFTFDDPWFPYEARTHAAHVSATGRKLPYDCYLRQSRSPVVFVVPGFGGHRQSKQVTALNELLYRGGHSVVAISSPTHPEFMQNAATLSVPGFLPEDSLDVHRALDAVWRDFYKRYGGRVYKRMLVGTSLGGAQVLSIAAAEARSDLVDFAAYLAINPPVQLHYAAEILDAYYNTPLMYPPAERDDRVATALQKAVALEIPRRQNLSTTAPLSPDEARFLIGLYYRLALHDVIWFSQERLDMGVLKTERRPLQRAAASQEILDFSVMEYAYAFLLPQKLKRDVGVSSADDLFAASDLRSLEAALRRNPKARVVCAANDILLSAEDIDWLRDVFGAERLAIDASGGHMGNLCDDATAESILRLLDDLLPSDEPEFNDASTQDVR